MIEEMRDEMKEQMTGETMQILSVNVGVPREVIADNGQRVTTAIYKEPIAGRVMARRLNLDGDRQADLSVHGGAYKAVYAYPAEHYEFWRAELPDMELPFGMFGENLTVTGLFEKEVRIGDVLKFGEALMQVTQPRLPCAKLAFKFGREEIIKRFMQSERSGFYLAVLEEGEVGAGDAITLEQRSAHEVTVTDIVRLYSTDKYNVDLLRRAAQVEALPQDWRDYFQERIEKLANQ